MPNLRRRKVSKQRLLREKKVREMPKIDLECKLLCGNVIYDLDADVKAVTCEWCVVRMIPLENKSKPTEKRPRGWHLKKHYVSPSGIEFSFGKEVVKNVPTDKSSKLSDKQTDRKVSKKPKGRTKKATRKKTKTKNSNNRSRTRK